MRNILFAILMLATSSYYAHAQQQYEQVMKVAQNKLAFFLSKIPSGQETAYGFNKHEDLTNCTLGKPYQVLVFSNDFYYGVQEKNNNYLVERNEWRVPVMLNGNNRLLLTVYEQGGTYIAAGIGGAALAKELGQKRNKINNKEACYLLRVYPLTADFIVHTPDNSLVNAEFIPMASAITKISALKNSDKASYNITEVKKMIQDQRIAKNQLIERPTK